MIQNIFSNFTSNRLASISLKPFSSPISFRGLDKDTFEKQDSELSNEQKVDLIAEAYNKITSTKEELNKAKAEYKRIRKLRKKQYSESLWNQSIELGYKINNLEEIFQDLIKNREKLLAKLNPNVAFLFDDSISWSKRREILASKDEIIPLASIKEAENDNVFYSIYYDSPYLVVNATGIGKFLDSSFDLNKENLEILSNPGLMSYSQFCSKFDFKQDELKRYIDNGLISPISLKNIFTGEYENVHLIDVNNDELCAKGVMRHNALKEHLPKQDKNRYISTRALSQLGFGTEDALTSEIQYKNLIGFTKTQEIDGKTQTRAYIDLADTRNEGALLYQRNQNKNIIDINTFAKLAKLDITDIEDAILSNEIDYISTCIFKRDENEFLFNLRNKKNARFLAKKQFEAQVAKKEILKERSEKISLRAQIAWSLCPETKKVAKQIIAIHPEIKEIFKKQDEIKDYDERKEKGEVSDDEIRPYITSQEKIAIKSFYKQMWAQAGTTEYNAALSQAKKYMADYQRGGLEAVDNLEIRELIKEFYEARKPQT